MDAAFLNDADAGGVEGINIAVDKLHAAAVKATTDLQEIMVVQIIDGLLMLGVIQAGCTEAVRKFLIFFFDRKTGAIEHSFISFLRRNVQIHLI